MRKSFEIGAETRDDQGKGASRRLRRTGKVPAILYGGKGEPSNITLNQLKLLNVIGDEKFYSSIITLKLDGKDQQAIVKDIQLHPAKTQVLHVDLQRVLADQAIRIHLPIHFLNETTCPGVKNPGRPGVASAHGCRNHLPAEGSARGAGSRHGRHEPERQPCTSRTSSCRQA